MPKFRDEMPYLIYYITHISYINGCDTQIPIKVSENFTKCRIRKSLRLLHPPRKISITCCIYTTYDAYYIFLRIGTRIALIIHENRVSKETAIKH